MTERDPRLDPKAGDVLHFASSRFTVEFIAHGRVTFDVSGWTKSTLPLRQWIEYADKWEVVHAAD